MRYGGGVHAVNEVGSFDAAPPHIIEGGCEDHTRTMTGTGIPYVPVGFIGYNVYYKSASSSFGGCLCLSYP